MYCKYTYSTGWDTILALDEECNDLAKIVSVGFFRAWIENARNGWPPATPARVVSSGRPPRGLSVTLWGAQGAYGSRFELRETRARRPTRRLVVDLPRRWLIHAGNKRIKRVDLADPNMCSRLIFQPPDIAAAFDW